MYAEAKVVLAFDRDADLLVIGEATLQESGVDRGCKFGVGVVVCEVDEVAVLVINVGKKPDVEVVDAIRSLGDGGAGVCGVVDVVAAVGSLNFEMRVENIAFSGLVFCRGTGGQDADLQDDLGGVGASAHHGGIHGVDRFGCGSGCGSSTVFRGGVGVVGVIAATVGEGVSLLLELDLDLAEAAVPLGIVGRVGKGVVV